MKRAAGAIANRNRAGQIEGGTSATTCRCRERSPSVSPLRSRSALFACDHAEPEPRSEQNPWNHHSDEDQAGGEDSFPDRDNGEEVELSGVFAVLTATLVRRATCQFYASRARATSVPQGRSSPRRLRSSASAKAALRFGLPGKRKRLNRLLPPELDVRLAAAAAVPPTAHSGRGVRHGR
jgi:hypothetical protein